MLSKIAQEKLFDIVLQFVNDRKTFTAYDITKTFRGKFPDIMVDHNDVKKFVDDNVDLLLFNYNCELTSFNTVAGNYFAKQYFPAKQDSSKADTVANDVIDEYLVKQHFKKSNDAANGDCRIFEINIPTPSVDCDQKGCYIFKEEEQEEQEEQDEQEGLENEENEENKKEQNDIIQKYCSGLIKAKFKFNDNTNTSLIIKEYELFLLKVEEIIGSDIMNAKITFNSEY